MWFNKQKDNKEWVSVKGTVDKVDNVGKDWYARIVFQNPITFVTEKRIYTGLGRSNGPKVGETLELQVDANKPKCVKSSRGRIMYFLNINGERW